MRSHSDRQVIRGPEGPQDSEPERRLWLRALARANAQHLGEDVAGVAIRLENQWRGVGDCEVVFERTTSHGKGALDAAEILALLRTDVRPTEPLERAWVEAQLACEETGAGRLVGARVALAPEHQKWRVYVVVPFLGMAFPSGKLNESPVGALISASSRFLGRGQREADLA
jgi:hypothetical protein